MAILSGGLKALGDLEICLGTCITLGRIFEQLWGFLAVLVPFLFVLTVVVFIHELGHFLVARWCGVRVKAFSIGFGREIFGFWDRHGTRWRVAWVPLGGYVKFMDDENSASAPSREALARMTEEERAGAFQTKPLASRAAIVAAGPVANFLLAIAIFALTFTVVGVHVTAPRVDELVPGGGAAAAGFRPGDLHRYSGGLQARRLDPLDRRLPN